MPNITLKRCTVLNPATLLPTPEDGEPHDCVATINEVCTPRVDLSDTPLPAGNDVLYVDSSSRKNVITGVSEVGYAIATQDCVVESARLPSNLSAQAAEPFALTRACILSEGKRVTIYTDSRQWRAHIDTRWC